MGVYVYTLNTKTHIVSGETLGIVEFSFKLGHGSDTDDRLYDKLCKPRINHFRNTPDLIPSLMTYSSFERKNSFQEGHPVYLLTDLSFLDSIPHTKVGVMKKQNRKWVIEFDEGASALIASHVKAQ